MKENGRGPPFRGGLWPFVLWDLTQQRKGSKMTNPTPYTSAARVAVIRARWHAEIVDRAHDSFLTEAATLLPQAAIDSFDVPGAFEMPLLAKKLAETGRYDAVVAIAFVVDGGIYRHDFVAAAVIDGLMQAQMTTGVPVFSVSLTPHNYQPVDVMTEFFADHFVKKGAEAVEAVRQVLTLTASLQAEPARKSA
jgi:6,7-dimethyl-8-ribityllumazine synthase